MISVSFSKKFKKSFEDRLTHNSFLQEKFFKRLEIFVIDPYHPILKTHKLSGDLGHLYSFSVDYDLRVIFYFVDKDKVVFENIGTHDQVY